MELRLKKYLEDGKFKDVPEKRSRTMSAIRGKHNRSTELRLRMALVKAGVSGWTLHPQELPGRPDFYFKKTKLSIFVDGCYWHGCPKCGHIPKTRTAFWKAKIKRNQERDKMKGLELKKRGIKSLRIWEHELKDKKDLDKAINKIDKLIQLKVRKASNEKRHS
jgi:DNA mismatch endonuclease (patch repair protein)